VHNERDARARRSRTSCDGSLRADIENAKLLAGHKSFRRSRPTRFVSRPPCARVRCLISLSDPERRCRCACSTVPLSLSVSLRATAGTGYTYTRVPHTVVHVRGRMLHRVTRTRATHGRARAFSRASRGEISPPNPLSHYHTNCSQSINRRFIGTSPVDCQSSFPASTRRTRKCTRKCALHRSRRCDMILCHESFPRAPEIL